MKRARRSCRALALLIALSVPVRILAQAAEFPPTQALPDEKVVIERLRGIVSVPLASDATVLMLDGFTGIDTSRTPLLSDPAAQQVLRLFLDKPASLASLDRLAIAVRTYLRAVGQPFITAYIPPQEVASGVVRLVVQRAKLEGELRVEGARHFPEAVYREAVPVTPGQEIDGRALAHGVAWLNDNPFRRATIAAEQGATTATTRLTLRVQDERPVRFTAGYSNTGTTVTDEDRLSFSVLWGDAFGRGDQLGYSLSADPRFRYSVSHSAHYTTIFRSRNSLTVYGSHSDVESILPQPLTQRGTSWQLGTRFSVPLAEEPAGWKHLLAVSADFKYSDNTLEFATVPITDNVTHIVQFGARWSGTQRGERSATALSASLYASPGGLSDRNTDAAFDASRAGAKARYAYGRFDARLSGGLPAGFSWSLAATAQAASGPLLGTEQLGGGGAGAVRGYRESSAFGDEGVLVNTELRFAPFSLSEGRDRGGFFVFLDAASLRNRGPGSNTLQLASSGIGLNYQFAGFSLAASYGWQHKEIPTTSGQRGSYGHISLQASF